MYEARADNTCDINLAPASVSLRDTGLDQPRMACAVGSLEVGARSFALIDEPNFYGTLSASLFVDYSILHATGFEFGVGARVIDYRFAQSAVFTTSELAVGPVHFSALRPRRSTWFGVPTVVGHGLRLEVPFSNSSYRDFTLAASPTMMATMFMSEKMHVHGRLSGLLWSIIGDKGADSRAALVASSDIGYQFLSFASLVAGAELQAGWYGLGLDHALVRGGFRFGVGQGAIELSAAGAPLGEERADVVLWLGYKRVGKAEDKPKRSRLRDWAR
jgi:hypothetical protein